jgi:hypothetical protein
MNALEISK